MSAIAFVAVAAVAGGQEPSGGAASTFLPPQHWAIAAARRLAMLGLASPSFGWGDGSLTRAAVGRVLHDAITTSRERQPELLSLATGYWARFVREFPAASAAIASREGGHALAAEGSASLGYRSASGQVYPVRSIDFSRENVAGPLPQSDLSELAASANVGLAAPPFLAASLTAEHRDGNWRIGEGYVLAAWKKLGVWGGRRTLQFGPGAGGGLVLNGTAPLTGVGVAFTTPFKLPGILRYLGSIRYESSLSRLDSNAAIREPWLLVARASISPHPRLLIGVTQAVMFGGDGAPMVAWNELLKMSIPSGGHTDDTGQENEIAAWQIRYRPPSPYVPLTLYLAWGRDEDDASWTSFPAWTIGTRIPAVPGLPALSVGIEHTAFAKPCTSCGHCACYRYATWYRHYAFPDGWTLDRQPLGHPLGGDGREWLVYGTWDNPASRLRVRGRAYLRQRGSYNLYAPLREGQSVGGRLSAVFDIAAPLEFLFTSALEMGATDWRESSVATSMRWIF